MTLLASVLKPVEQVWKQVSQPPAVSHRHLKRKASCSTSEEPVERLFQPGPYACDGQLGGHLHPRSSCSWKQSSWRPAQERACPGELWSSGLQGALLPLFEALRVKTEVLLGWFVTPTLAEC